MSIENPKKNTHNIHMNESQNEDFKNMFIKHPKKKKKKKKKDFWNQGSILTSQKSITTIWLRFLKDKNHAYFYYFILERHI
jgi:hypothetical protein